MVLIHVVTMHLSADFIFQYFSFCFGILFRFHIRSFGTLIHVLNTSVNRRIPKVESFFLYYQRSLHYPLIDGEDVLAQESDEKDLNGAEEEHADKHWRHAGGETVPPDELHYEVGYGDQHADGAAHAAEEYRNSEADFRVAGKAEHGGVIEGIPVVVGDSGSSSGLGVGDFLAAETELGHDAPQEGGGVVQVSHYVDECLVIESEAGELGNLVYGRHFFDGLVVDASEALSRHRLTGACRSRDC